MNKRCFKHIYTGLTSIMCAAFNFLILFGLSCVLCSCEGQVNPPPNGNRLIFAPGSNARIEWTFFTKKPLEKRTWYFTSTDGTFDEAELAIIHGMDEPIIFNSGLTGVSVEGNTTLVLKNVNQSYDGTYLFILSAGPSTDRSPVIVTIAATPSVYVNCSRTMTVNETDDVTCLCEGKGGKPPANVTWYDENGKNISATGNESQVLILRNVSKTDRGTYTCVAKSYETAENKTQIKLYVKFPPENVSVVFSTKIPKQDKPFTITCDADSHPPPEFQIFFNDTKLLANEMTYTIPKLNNSHSGFYKCIAKNKLDSRSSSARFLRVDKDGRHGTPGESNDEGLGIVDIVGIVIGVLVLVLLVVIGVAYWRKSRGNRRRSRRDKNKQRTDDKHIYDSVTPDQGKVSRSSANPQHHEYAILEPPVPVRYTTRSETENMLHGDARDKPREDDTTRVDIDKV